MTHPTLFLSYSHQDENKKEALLTHLGVLQRAGLVELWSDDRIRAGATWKAEIDRAIARARIAILLISINFLTSDFILDEEVPALLQRRQSEGLVIFPIIARACAWQQVVWLAEMQVRPKDGRPVWREGGRYVDEELAVIAAEVAEIVKELDPAPALGLMKRYALDREKLEQEAGPRARAVVRALFETVLARLKTENSFIAQNYPANPSGYEIPMRDWLAGSLKTDLELAARLDSLLRQYETAIKEHTAPATTYQATISGTGSVAQGEAATATTATGGSIAIGGSVGGDVILGDKEKKDE